jgi:hypothetical protein
MPEVALPRGALPLRVFIVARGHAVFSWIVEI